MNHLDKFYTGIYKVERSVVFNIVFLGSSEVAVVVLCLHHCVRNLERIQNKAGREDNGNIVTCDL